MSTILLANTTIESATSYIIDLEKVLNYGIEVAAIVTSTAKTFVDAGVNTTTDNITSTAHGFANCTKVRLTTTGVLPTGLALATDCYVLVIDANTFTLYDTLAHCLTAVSSGANTVALGRIDITAAAGGGTHTATPVAVSGCSYKLQKSNSYDSVTNPSPTWVDLVAGETNSVVTNNITVTATTAASGKDVSYKYARILFAISAGSVGIKVTASLGRNQ